MRFRSPDHGQDHVSHNVEQAHSEVVVTDNVVDEVTHSEVVVTDDVVDEVMDEKSITTTINTSLTHDITEHTVDRVTSNDDQLQTDDNQPHPQDVSTNIKDSPGEYCYYKHLMRCDVHLVTGRRRRKNKFKPKE